MREVTWIYHPRSGDRVRAIIGSPQVGWVEYPNGCRHVVGDLCHLIYEAAEAGRWWRDAAGAAASGIVSALRGGAAWDEQGTIHLLVPRERAASADLVMREVRPHHSVAEDQHNLGAMFRAGVVEVGKIKEGLILQPCLAPQPAEEVTAADAPTAPWPGTWHGGVRDALEPAKAAVEAA